MLLRCLLKEGKLCLLGFRKDTQNYASVSDVRVLDAHKWSKESGTDTTRESIDTFCVFKVVLRFNIMVRSDFRSIEVEVSIILLYLH